MRLAASMNSEPSGVTVRPVLQIPLVRRRRAYVLLPLSLTCSYAHNFIIYRTHQYSTRVLTFNATANGANVIRLSYTSDHYSLLVNDSDVLCPLASPGKCEALALQEARDRALAVSNLQNGDDVTQEKPTIPDGGWITVKRKNRKVGPNTPATVTADVKITGSIEVKTDGLASLASLGGDKNQDEPKDNKPAKDEDAGRGLEISQNNLKITFPNFLTCKGIKT